MKCVACKSHIPLLPFLAFSQFYVVSEEKSEKQKFCWRICNEGNSGEYETIF